MKIEATQEQKSTINQFNNYIDGAKDITLFQIALIKDINYYTLVYGSYRYIPAFVDEKYKEILQPKEIKKEIDDLVKRDLIEKTIKKTILNGRYHSLVTITLK